MKRRDLLKSIFSTIALIPFVVWQRPGSIETEEPISTIISLEKYAEMMGLSNILKYYDVG